MRLAVASNVTLIYLFNDYLGSSSVATDGSTASVVSKQEFDPWGTPRAGSGNISQTDVNYTGQIKDSSTGLLYYHARYYDPAVGRFTSPDSIVPGAASGKGGAAASLDYDSDVALRPLAVDFHETGFATEMSKENRFTLDKGFYFQLNEKDQQAAKYQDGPTNPQALNRYSYVLNNPVRYDDPTGHFVLVILGITFVIFAGVATIAYIVALQHTCQQTSGCTRSLSNLLKGDFLYNGVLWLVEKLGTAINFANRKQELGEINDVADAYGIDEATFRDYIHEVKQNDHRKGNKNARGDFTKGQLKYLAEELLGKQHGEDSEEVQ